MQIPARRLLSGILDYAGLFPPAKLEMNPAVENYLRYVHGPEKWFVSRFVCNVGRLPVLLAEIDQHNPEEVSGRDPIPVTVVGTMAQDHKHWGSTLEHDADAMDKFQKAAERRAEIVGYEMRIPDHKHVEEYSFDLQQFDHVDVFVELPWTPEIPETIGFFAELETLGVKARTGGTEASAFPSSDQLAGFIQACAQADMRFKCTAGLHEPLPHADLAIGVTHHGFVNVLTATALSLSEDLSRRELTDILEDQQSDNFSLDDTGLAWKGHRAAWEALDAARDTFVAFGSCSVNEPLEGLNKMGWMKEAVR